MITLNTRIIIRWQHMGKIRNIDDTHLCKQYIPCPLSIINRISLCLTPTAFAVTPFLGDITPFCKPGRRFGNYVASLGRSFTVVNIGGSRPAFRVSSVVIRSVFTNGLSIQT